MSFGLDSFGVASFGGVAQDTALSAIISGTMTSTTVQQNIVDGGKTASLTISNATFKAAGTGPIGSTADSQALLDAYVSAQSEVAGFNAEVGPLLTPAMLTRIDDENALLELPAVPNYVITANETLTWTIPTDVLDSGGPLVATPTNTILSALGGSLIIGDSQMSELTIDGESQFVTVSIIDTNGDPLTGLVFNSAGLTASYVREGITVAVDITLATMVLNTWVSGGFKEIDATKQAGDYQLGVPDALAVAGTFSAKIIMLGAASMRQANHPVSLVNLIDLGDDDRPFVTANAHTSGQTIADNAIKTGYSLTVTPPTAVQNRTEMDSNSVQLAAILNDTDVTIPALIATLSAKVNTLAIPKNAPFANIPILMLLTSNNQAALGLTVTATRSIDGAAAEDVTGTIVELSDGLYLFSASADDTNGDSIVWVFKGADANNSYLPFQAVS